MNKFSSSALGVQFELKHLFLLVTGLAAALGVARANDFDGWGVYFGVMISTYVTLFCFYRFQVAGPRGHGLYRMLRGLLWVVAVSLFGPWAIIPLVVLGAWLREQERYTAREFAWMFVTTQAILGGAFVALGIWYQFPADIVEAGTATFFLSIGVFGLIMFGFAINVLSSKSFAACIVPPALKNRALDNMAPDSLTLPSAPKPDGPKSPEEVAEQSGS